MFYLLLTAAEARNLIKAAVLFRHGAREQQGSGFPPDPQAHSQLTTVGMRQLFILG
jgi:hypothetical protein